MKLKTRVGQILLIHTKDENYASLYEEAFSKQGQSVQLFAVIEIAPRSRGNNFKNHKAEYDSLAKTLVSAFKKVYVSSPVINEETFERALTAINSSLGKLGTKSKSNWFSELHVVIAALTGNDLFISTAGNALAYLHRGGNVALLSEDLSSESKPVKVFANYAAGRLMRGDRIALGTSQLFNYVSFDKFRESLEEDGLEEACQEIISTLSDIKDIAFAAFIFETLPEAEKQPILAEKEISTSILSSSFAEEAAILPKSKNKYLNILNLLLNALKTLIEAIFIALRFVFLLIYRLFKKNKRPVVARKSLITVTAVVLVLLVGSIAFSIWRKAAGDKKDEQNFHLTRAEGLLSEAEAALIYQDENRVLTLVSEAEGILTKVTISDLSDQAEALKNQALEIKGKVNKEVVIENPTVLATFTTVPTDLIRSSEGFLAHNRDTGQISFYDFRNGESKDVLKDQNLNSLVLGGYIGGTYGFVFLNSKGKFSQLDAASDKLTEYQAETPNMPDMDKANIKDFTVLGTGNTARIYLLDSNQNQIWRFRITQPEGSESPSFGSAEQWLKSEAAFAEARDLTIDNGIYVLFGDRVERYFNGSTQNFSLSPVSPGFANLQKIYTTPEQQFLYILDSENGRILIYNKNGHLQNQLKSAKFREASDLYVDEKNKIVYLVSGTELLQVNF